MFIHMYIFLSRIQIKKLFAVSFMSAFSTNAMTSHVLSHVSPCGVVVFLDSLCTKFSFWRFNLLDVVLVFWISILNTLKSLQNC